MICPLRKRHSHPIYLFDVVAVRFHSGAVFWDQLPGHITRLVVLIVVNAAKAVLPTRTFSNVPQKFLEPAGSYPTKVDTDAPTSIEGVVISVPVLTPLDHHLPASVGWTWYLPCVPVGAHATGSPPYPSVHLRLLEQRRACPAYRCIAALR